MRTIFLVIIAMTLNVFNAFADEVNLENCINHIDIINKSAESRLEFERLEKLTEEFIKTNKITEDKEYIIPVVFHVFGTDFAGKEVNLDIIKSALNHTNNDFNGLNKDYETSDPNFDEVKSKLKIRFELAKIDPDGNPTNGVTFHDPVAGLANDNSNINAIVSNVSWDNFSYMNVFITLDLFGDGVEVKTGYAFHPNNSMSNSGLARVVYNGRYLLGNTNDKNASILTHEFGHWLNLFHTFEGGCTYPNDYVDDTPPVDKSGMGCPAINCENNPINAENFMDYNPQCYSMFTSGQIDRMKAALEFDSRKTLWQEDNLIKVGLDVNNSVDLYENDVVVFPNPVTNGEFNINNYNNNLIIDEISLYDMLGNNIASYKSVNLLKTIDVSKLESGVYVVRMNSNYGIITKKLLIQKK